MLVLLIMVVSGCSFAAYPRGDRRHTALQSPGPASQPTKLDRIDVTLVPACSSSCCSVSLPAMLIGVTFTTLPITYPMTLDLTAWYAPAGLFGVAVLVCYHPVRLPQRGGDLSCLFAGICAG